MRLIPSVCSRRFVFTAFVLGLALAGSLLVVVPGDAQAPAGRQFNGDAAMVLNYIKPDQTAAFEKVCGQIKEALNKSSKPER